MRHGGDPVYQVGIGERKPLTSSVVEQLMTRNTQKNEERAALVELMRTIDIDPDFPPIEGEAPDFIIQLSNRLVGIEMTKFQAASSSGGTGRRGVEAAWEALEESSRPYREAHKDLHSLSILFRFNRALPRRNEYQQFFAEILTLVQSLGSQIDSEFKEFSWGDRSPLMMKHLAAILMRQSEHPEWYSNLTAGLIPAPAEIVARIVREKSTKAYRSTDDLWLVIQTSARPSEMVLPVGGSSELNADPNLARALIENEAFSRVSRLAK